MVDDPYLTRSLGFLLADVSRLMRQRLDARASALDLTRAQWRVLAQLRRREGQRQTELADVLEIEPITIGRHIDRLVAKGLVERRPDPKDRRAWRIYLSREVQPTLDQMRALSETTREEALAGIATADRERLVDMLLKIKANMAGLEPISEEETDEITARSQAATEPAGGGHVS